jgi:hypothetical protein
MYTTNPVQSHRRQVNVMPWFMHLMYSARVKHAISYLGIYTVVLPSYASLDPDTVPSFLRSTAQTRPSRFQVDGKSSRQEHIPPRCPSLPVSASASHLCLPTYCISPCLSRTFPHLDLLAPLTIPSVPIQSNQSSDIPRCSTHYSPTSQAHGQPARSLYHCASAPAQRDRQQAADQARPRPPAKPTQRSPPVHRRQPNS